jgi:hypothetical protein
MSELPGMWEEADLSGGWADTDEMSARERLVTALTNLLATSRRGRMDAHRAEAERLVDAALHEAAERIRTSKRLRDYTDDHMSDCNAAADYIDPEVSS